MKKCTKCLRELPLSEFYPRPDHPGSYRSRCKECCRGGGVAPRSRSEALWQTASKPISAVLVSRDGVRLKVDLLPNGTLAHAGEPQGTVEQNLDEGTSLIVEFAEGRIVATSERRAVVKGKTGTVDVYKWKDGSSLTKLFSHGRTKPAIWRAPSPSATLRNVRLVTVSESLADTLASARKMDFDKG